MSGFFSKVAHSLMLRLLMVLAVMAGILAAVVLISWQVFQSIDTQMTTLSDERLPGLQASAEVAAATGRTRALLSSALAVSNTNALTAVERSANQVFSEFRTALSHLPPSERSELMPVMEQAEAAIRDLYLARRAEFSARAEMAAMIDAAASQANATSALVEEANDTAFFDMVLRGEETTAVIEDSLTKLVDEEFTQFQNALSIRGEINLIAGLALSHQQARESDIGSIIMDLSQSALDRLDVLVKNNRDVPAFADVLPPLTQAIDTYRAVFERAFGGPGRSEILAARLAVDKALSPAIDDIYFSLVIESENAKETNKTALTTLLEEEVEVMRWNAALDAATKEYFALLLRLAGSGSNAEMSLNQGELTTLAGEIRNMVAGTRFADQPDLSAMLALEDAASGMAHQWQQVQTAQTSAQNAVKLATKSVVDIAHYTNIFSLSALQNIGDTVTEMSHGVRHAGTQISHISLLAFVVFAVAPLLLWLLVTRPLLRVTKVTERLAKGDLSEITGLAQNPGELGRMVSALHVFRANALKNIRMQEEERERERAALEEERAREKQRIEEERAKTQEAAERDQRERAMEAKHRAIEEQRQAKEASERKARMEEQTAVVTALATGLKSLAQGDLSFQISEAFPEAYDSLRKDYNAAVVNLSHIVEKLNKSARNIEANCLEIAESSNNLANRTEHAATTLQETANAIGDLSSRVSTSAESASSANQTIQNIRDSAKQNNLVMAQATDAMNQVEESSGKITSIVDIIDSIAFQTNLLALNAGVEAARAGTAGRGFAVVASEVRVLAQRCTEAANEISSVVAEGSETVKQGVALTEQANAAMEKVNDGISDISKIVDEISSSAEQQASGLASVNQAIQQLDGSTQQNAAMFEETNASNQVMTREAEALISLVKSFNLTKPASNEMTPERRRA